LHADPQTRQVLGFRDRRLVAIHAEHRRQLDQFLEAALGMRRLLEPPLPIRLATPGCRGLILRAAPIAPNNDVFDVFRPAALVTLTDLDRPYRVKRNELVALFGLTEREADVASQVSEGKTTEQAAQALSISEHTLRQHLKAIFGKMEISRQADLVAIVARLN
jgi:DNA-binding CsgD family transcriptional regulator